MSNFKLYMKNGEVIEHLHKGRPGGSYSKVIEYHPGFVTIVDEYHHKTSYPSDQINRIEEWSTW